MLDLSFLLGGNIVQQLTNYIVQLVSSNGYLSVFILMTLESALVPIPSEIVMPFAGYLVFLKKLDFVLVGLTGATANLAGSLIAYLIGLYVGRAAVLKYGKYVLLREKHLKIAEKWFSRHGDKTILISRMLPVIRTVISLPAGFARMNFKKFITYTFVGSLPWNFFLTYLGFVLAEKWETILNFAHYADVAVLGAAALIVVWLALKKMKKL